VFHIVLVQPEIPQNTGNISRTCSVTGCALHLVRPLGFSIDESHVKRAGLDYWDTLSLTLHDSFEEVFYSAAKEARFFFATTKAEKAYSNVEYRDGDYLVFGRETAGLGDEFLAKWKDNHIRIPMLPDKRSLNLSNSVAIVLYEALRQTGFPGLV
jgi:tRNA (cytidine/uridine-2'-O-)-methyltransferase